MMIILKDLDFGLSLREEILLPASVKNLVSGELYNGLLNNLNTLEEAEKLDALLT